MKIDGEEIQPVVVITGASSGLGALILQELDKRGMVTVNWSQDTGVDVRDWESVCEATERVHDGYISANILINCAGINGIEYLPKLQLADFDNIMNTNARGIYYATAALLPIMTRPATVLNIVSNAAHIPMTSSLAYNMSKAAALMATKQLARELIKTHGITVFSISPNKLKGTGMSQYIEKRVCELRGWTPAEAEKYQLAALPAGEETDPAVLAEFIGFLLSSRDRHKYLNGCDIPYGGPTI